MATSASGRKYFCGGSAVIVRKILIFLRMRFGLIYFSRHIFKLGITAASWECGWPNSPPRRNTPASTLLAVKERFYALLTNNRYEYFGKDTLSGLSTLT